jgi:hypothetical protein
MQQLFGPAVATGLPGGSRLTAAAAAADAVSAHAVCQEAPNSQQLLQQ